MGTVREKAKGVLEHLLHQEELQPIFQEQFITLRNGRYVLLIKSDFKHRLEGINPRSVSEPYDLFLRAPSGRQPQQRDQHPHGRGKGGGVPDISGPFKED